MADNSQSTRLSQKVAESETASELTGKARRRFYEPIVLYRSLFVVSSEKASFRPTRPLARALQTDREQFETFVYKLAMICDNERGGTTVCSFFVGQDEQGVEYVFGCNQVKEPLLAKMRNHIKSVLNLIAVAGKAESPSKDFWCRKLFDKIMEFSKPRIQSYLTQLLTQAVLCLETQNNAFDVGCKSVESATS
jgi:hypothetical protein